MHSRRTFLSMTMSAAACGRATAATPSVAVNVGEAVLATVPRDFNGLSYENTQLYNPDYFSAKNIGLVNAFQKLSKNGVLRLGGSLSNSCRWKSEAGTFETPAQTAIIEDGKTKKWEWKLTDPKVRDHRDGAITPVALSALRDFCDATGWRVIYGLDCTAGGPDRARDEAAHVVATLGEKLLAFQVANEPDFLNQYRKNGEGIGDFELWYRDYRAIAEAVRKAVPQAPFAGPDTAVSLEWVEAYAKREGKNAVLLSSHFYAMGPGTDPSQNAALLLSGKSRLPALIAQAQETARVRGIPFRLTETNSCYRGGRPDVSDAFASALWGADMMLQTAASGMAGVNLHTGGDGYYTAIAVTLDGGTELRPLYFGMQFAEIFAGAEIVVCETSGGANVTVTAARKGKMRMLALINKGPETISIAQDWLRPTRIVRLSGPSLDAKMGVHLTTVPAPHTLATTVPPISASILIGA